MDEREKIRREIFNRPKKIAQGQPVIFSEEVGPEINPELLKMFPPERIQRIMKKEVRRYKAALERKWRNWMAAVSK